MQWKAVSGKEIQVVLLADEEKRCCSTSGKGLGLIVLQRQARFLPVSGLLVVHWLRCGSEDEVCQTSL